MSAFLLGIFLFLVGPSSLLGFNESMTLIIAGLFLTACFLAPLAIPVMPEVLSAVEEQYKATDRQRTGDYASALFNTALGLGQVLGPLVGAPLYASIGFRKTEDVMALICISFAIIYFFCAGGLKAFKRTFSKEA